MGFDSDIMEWFESNNIYDSSHLQIHCLIDRLYYTIQPLILNQDSNYDSLYKNRSLYFE